MDNSNNFDVRAILPVQKAASGSSDLPRNVDATVPLLHPGITDLQVAIRLPSDYSAAFDRLAELVDTFSPFMQ